MALLKNHSMPAVQSRGLHVTMLPKSKPFDAKSAFTCRRPRTGAALSASDAWRFAHSDAAAASIAARFSSSALPNRAIFMKPAMISGSWSHGPGLVGAPP
jgi:hypothetical protein